MKFKIISGVLMAIALIVCVRCGSDDGNGTTTTDDTAVVTKTAVLENYAAIVYQSYKDSYDKAVDLQTAIHSFVDTPSEAGLTAAKTAWLAAREPYGQTEAYRETGGPIDTPDGGIEGQLNAWPLDENYIDYVRDGSGGVTNDGIINNTAITIDETALTGANEGVGGNGVPEKNVSTGYHAIEFLLWGQDFADPSNGLAGQRAYTDYVTDGSGTHAHQDRRGTYLKVVTNVLVKDLKTLVDTWAVGGPYRGAFLALPEDTALQNIINGIFYISGEELSTERMAVAVAQDQEDEQSCFSDNTHRDIFANAKGVDNVIFGRYGSISGASFYDLVRQANADQGAKLKTAAEDVQAKVDAILTAIMDTKKFDGLIEEETLTSGGIIIQAVNSLKTQAAEISASASAIAIQL